jgi:hypothetical protein
VSRHRETLPFPVGYGPHDGVMCAMDKARMTLVAQECGLAVPRTASPADYGRDPFPGPAIVKPALQTEVAEKAEAFADPRRAIAHASSLERAGGRAIVQEQVEGRLIALTLVAGPRGIVSVAQQLAEKVWPHPAGVTARGVTVPVDRELLEAVERLLARLQWEGMAQLQFLQVADGRRLLIDLNPRFYGSLALAVRAGANHPDVWGRLITGRDVARVEARPGVRYQWFSRDLRASLASPRPVLETARCVRVGATAAHSLWSWSEPALAPRFLASQLARKLPRRLPSRCGSGDARATAALHGLPVAAASSRALRSRPVPPRPVRVAQRLAMKAGRLSFEDAWLAPLQELRRRQLGQAADGPPRLLVRVDEFPYYSGFDDPKFGYEASERFHLVMAEAGVQHLMSVVPQWTHEPLVPGSSGGRRLDDRDCALLERMRGDGVTLAQHGCTHRTRYTDPRRHSELCGLSPAALGQLLDEGRAKLAEAGVHPRVLVPPFNRFDASQWQTLAERYAVVTGGPESVALMGFHGGPQWRGDAVYLPCYAPLYATAARVLPAVEALIEQRIATWIPVVLHTGWEIDDDFAALRRLAQRIAPYAASWDEFLADVDVSHGN